MALASGLYKSTNHIVAFERVQLGACQVEGNGIHVGTVLSDLSKRLLANQSENGHAKKEHDDHGRGAAG